MLNKDYIIPALGGRLGNNMFMIAHAYVKSLEFNKQMVIAKEQLIYEGNDYSKNIFSKFQFIETFYDNKNCNPQIPSNDKHSIYVGYYQSESYFEKYSESVKSLFSPTFEFITRIKEEIPLIFNTEVTVINVRRGDYLHYPNYHPTVSPEYIFKALELVPSKQYLIASDDITWCKENLNLPGAIYLEGWKSHEQLWIMSMCHHFIISNSSFSWWAAYLSRNPNKKVVSPETWYGPEGPNQWSEIYCKGWIILPTKFKDGFIYPVKIKRPKYKIILKTTHKNLWRVDNCANTWLKGLDFVCLTDKLSNKYPEISGSLKEDYNSSEEKTVHMINLVKNTSQFDEYDWLVFIDDDAILNVNKWGNIIEYLDKNIVYGLYMHGSYQPQPTLIYPSGGSGYFISPQRIKNSQNMTDKGFGFEDVSIGKWIEENEITLLDHYFINGEKHNLLLNGWFPFPEEYDKIPKNEVNDSDYPQKLLNSIINHQEKQLWLNQHLTHHYIRNIQFMEYINKAFNMNRLTEIANRIGTDKGTMDYGHHYTILYHELLNELSKRHVKMLEIGVADPRFPGASLEMWNEYFPDIELIGYDINPDAKQFEKDNVYVFIGDQNNPEHLEECIKTYGADYDLIVDDGSHYGEHIVTSFKTLYPYLKEGGIYIIEDLHAAQLDEKKMIEEIKNLNYECKEFYQTHHNKLLIIVK